MKWCIALMVWLPAVAFARAGGIETTECSGCHGTGNQQTTLTLTPSTFNPGDTVTVRVRIAGSGTVGGLALTTGGIGTFTTVSGQGTRLSSNMVVHSTPRAAAGGAVTFDVRWTAPAAPGGVVFDVATVLGNGDNGRGGDQSKTASLTAVFGCAGTTYFRDVDADGVGSAQSGTRLDCAVPQGFSARDGDCDDFDNRKTPGAEEACNGVDDNCNGQVDEGLASVTTWPDLDGDGFGWQLGAPMTGCAGGRRAMNDLDCDDTSAAIRPSATEICNLKDDDCDGQVDEGAQVRCGVGWCARFGPTCNQNDCVPGSPLPERCNALDDDCDGVVDDGAACEAGLTCQGGKCVATTTPEPDAGQAEPSDAGPSTPAPEPEPASCAVGAGPWLAGVLLLLRRR